MIDKPSILIVEDEKNLGETLKEYLVDQGYYTDLSPSVSNALDRLNNKKYEIVLLDIGLPDGNGLELGKLITKQFKRTKILFLSAQNSPDIKLTGLEMGAIDYITKPFLLKELLIRLKKFSPQITSPPTKSSISFFKAGNLEAHFDKFELINGKGEIIKLGNKENSILRMLCERPNVVLPREELIEKIWGEESFPSNRTVDNYIVKLRKWTDSYPDVLEIQNVRGVGYKLIIKEKGNGIISK